MDNFYNSFDLTKKLESKKIFTTGTLRHERGGPSQLPALKKDVGSKDKIVLEKDGVQMLIWNDRKPVFVISNCYNCDETVEGKKKEIPKVINEYDKYMGGVDKFDQMIKYYPMKRKSNRWPQKFSMHIFEILLHNCYVAYINSIEGKPCSHFEFIERIIDYLFSMTKSKENAKNNAFHTFSKNYHLPIKIEKRGSCHYCKTVDKTHSTTGIICCKCNLYLCTSPCFYSYHVNLCEDFSESDEED